MTVENTSSTDEDHVMNKASSVCRPWDQQSRLVVKLLIITTCLLLYYCEINLYVMYHHTPSQWEGIFQQPELCLSINLAASITVPSIIPSSVTYWSWNSKSFTLFCFDRTTPSFFSNTHMATEQPGHTEAGRLTWWWSLSTCPAGLQGQTAGSPSDPTPHSHAETHWGYPAAHTHTHTHTHTHRLIRIHLLLAESEGKERSGLLFSRVSAPTPPWHLFSVTHI